MKVFPHGTGSGNAAVDYLTRLDYEGRADNPPKVLRGDTEQTKQIINSLDTKWKFTAGVLSWHPDDIVSVAQEEAMMNDFEKLAFAGLDKDAYNILWVRHKHANHHELHFVMPRVELNTGKAYNACPPNWQKDFDVFRDMHNVRENWARPDDPSRARMYAPEHANLQKARLKRWGANTGSGAKANIGTSAKANIGSGERDQATQAIHDYVISQIEQGAIENRNDIIIILQNAGFTINRQGKDYISIKDVETEAKFRLKGNIYAEHWTNSNGHGSSESNSSTSTNTKSNTGNDRPYTTPTEQSQARADYNRECHQRELENLERQYIEVIEKRSQYNRKRYQSRDREHAKDNSFQIQAMQSDFWQAMHAHVPHGSGAHSGDNARQLGTDSMAQLTNKQPQGRNNNAREIQETTSGSPPTRARNPQEYAVENMELETGNTRRSEIHHSTNRGENDGHLQNHGREASLETWKLENVHHGDVQFIEATIDHENLHSTKTQNQKEGMNNDRTRNTLTKVANLEQRTEGAGRKGEEGKTKPRTEAETRGEHKELNQQARTLGLREQTLEPNAKNHTAPTNRFPNTNSNSNQNTNSNTNARTNELAKSNRSTLERILTSHKLFAERLERLAKFIQYIGNLVEQFKQKTHVNETSHIQQKHTSKGHGMER